MKHLEKIDLMDFIFTTSSTAMGDSKCNVEGISLLKNRIFHLPLLFILNCVEQFFDAIDS